MSLEKIKRKFIEYMELVHGAHQYPKNFFGCLLSIIIESEPVSQERIMELTGFSQATVSLAIQKIQLLMPIRALKKVGDRKLYYMYEGPHEGFLLDLLQRRVDVQDIDIHLIETTLSKQRERSTGTSSDKRFLAYLTNMRLYQNLIHELRRSGVEPFRLFLKTKSFEGLKLLNSQVLKKGKFADFLSQLKTISLINGSSFLSTEGELIDYSPLKIEYFTGIKASFNPLYSQTLANNLIVMHSVLIEGCTNQERIEKSTLLPRSTISEILAQLVKRGIVRVTRKEGSRIKLYHPTVSLSELMLSSIDRVVKYESAVMKRLSEFISITRKVSPTSKQTKQFLAFLRNLKKAYSYAEKFSKNMKVELVIKLKEEFDRGFVFF